MPGDRSVHAEDSGRVRDRGAAMGQPASLPAIVARQSFLLNLSGCCGRSHAPGDLLAAVALDHDNAALDLHLQPELRVVAEIPARA